MSTAFAEEVAYVRQVGHLSDPWLRRAGVTVADLTSEERLAATGTAACSACSAATGCWALPPPQRVDEPPAPPRGMTT